MSVIMFFLEFLCSFVELYLSGLGGSDLFVKFTLFPANFDCQLFDLQVEFSDFGVIFLTVFLKGDVIFFFLLAGDGPLFEFLLVPVEFKFDLFNFLVDSEDSDLDIIESFLMFNNNFIEFFYFTLKSATLSFGNLPHVILCFSFFVFRIN